jgi:hypothetical protein
VSTAEPTVETVEAMVRRQMSTALGGRRGMLEAGIPGIAFTVLWLTTKDLRLALVVSLVAAGAALALRLVQRSSIQYVGNAVFGVLIGWVFVRIAAANGGSATDQALAYFLPGILVSSALVVLMVGSVLAGWPLVGFMLGSVTGDPTAWHENKQVVTLCSRLTWIYIVPSIVGVGLQGPIWLLGHTGAMDADLAVLLLGILRVGLGWVLRVASWAAMIWLLARNHTPLDPAPGTA